MDHDMRLHLGHTVDVYQWLSKYSARRKDDYLSWVSSFHKDHLSCRLAHDFVADEAHGSYNWTSQVIFSNEESWVVRFPRGGKVSHPDEKVENEVAAMLLIQKYTDVPIPELMAWGLSSDNALGLGPFIMTRFVEGISLGSVLQDTSVDYRLLGDVDDAILERVLRQIIRIQLQLARLNFARIGCPSPNSDDDEKESAYTATINRRPFPWKTHEILHYGGVDVLCDPPQTTFETTSDYFQYLADADMAQLLLQHNSVDDLDDAEEKYRYWKVMRELASEMSLPQYEHGPFKLICDDFNPTNMIVNNTTDLEIVAVVDWEWSYAGPYQMFWSPPRWLIMRHPTGLPAYGAAFDKYRHVLDLYISILEEEERANPPGTEAQERPSMLMKQALAYGRACYQQIIQAAFNGPFHVPFRELEKTVDNFERMVDEVDLDEVLHFVEVKKQHLQIYKMNRLDQEDAERSIAHLLIH